MEESITSSQLEGAATTRRVAKEMLQRGRRPRNRNEQMIFNNFRAMQFVRELRGQPLTPVLIKEIQRILTEETLEDPSAAGRFRRFDDHIVIEDPEGHVLHTPPTATELDDRVEQLCAFANTQPDDESVFIHPVIRAIVLHLWLAYDHPFVDGNGRTARALFYWSMAAQDYWLIEFVSISQILRNEPGKYSRAFLYTETDENDATYFILYQLQVISRAIKDLHSHLQRKAVELRETNKLLQDSGFVAQNLNQRQLALIHHALRHPNYTYTIQSHQRSHHVSYQSARTDLLKLSELELLEQAKTGKRFVFMAPGDLHQRIVRMEGRTSRSKPSTHAGSDGRQA